MKYYSLVHRLDTYAHKLNQKKLLPKKVANWFCDAWDYQISGGGIGHQNFPLNPVKLSPEDIWDDEEL